jgi:hypothetical protein
MRKRLKLTKKTRKLQNVSGKMPCPICQIKNFLVIHHINGRDIPQAEFDHNLASICPSCHTKVHYGEIIIEKWIMGSNGKELIWHRKGESSITGEDSNPPLLANKKTNLQYTQSGTSN